MIIRIKTGMILTLIGGFLLPKNIKGEEKRVFEEVTIADLITGVQDEKPEIWSYSDCLNYAIEHNSDIRYTLLSILQSDEDILSAKDAWLPTVDFSTTQGYTNLPIGTGSVSENNIYKSSYGVNASWTVWEGNVRKYRLESARLIRKQQQLIGEYIIKELKIGILQSYLNILYS